MMHTCPNCGRDIPRNAAVCPSCEVRLPVPPPGPGHAHDLGTCPYCQSEIAPQADVARCAKCNTPYHADCWRENGGCAVYGCASKACVPPLPPAPPARPPTPPLAQPSGALRCPHCYARILPHDERCLTCGADLLPRGPAVPGATGPARAGPVPRAKAAASGFVRFARAVALAFFVICFLFSMGLDVKLGIGRGDVAGWVWLDTDTDSDGDTHYHVYVSPVGISSGPTMLGATAAAGSRLQAAISARGVDPFAARFGLPSSPFGNMPPFAFPGMGGAFGPSFPTSSWDKQLLCRLHYAGLGRHVVHAFEEFSPGDESRLMQEPTWGVHAR